MREKIIFISLLGLLLPVSIIIAQVNPSTIDVQNLKRCYNLAHSDSNNNQKTYFEVFPSTFAEFKDIFGYEETKDGDIYGELYEESMEYITKFFLLYKVIDSYDFSNKIINLCINGEWQADGVNYLHANIVNIVTSDSNHDCYYDHFDVLICYNDTLRETLLSCLEQYSEDDILSFWQFYLDGSQVIPVDEELLNRTKCFIRKYPILFKQIDKAYALSQRKKIFNAQINYKEDEIYFYHGDHLGSANWITDAVGQPVQYIHYAPYGELIADTRLTNYRERFHFTGKERDKESGYDYFGARYYWALLMHWLSVDPLAHQYPWLSPYAYCAWNPIKFIDPTGEWIAVTSNDDMGASYTVVAGAVDKGDCNVYVVGNDYDTKSGIKPQGAKILGQTVTPYSFSNEEGQVVLGSVIDLNDKSGDTFLARFQNNEIPLYHYVFDNPQKEGNLSGRNGGNCDFKFGGDVNRGMPLSILGGQIGTARDVGNFAAGYLAGAHGISFPLTRIAFDFYQKGIEPPVSKSAQNIGYFMGYYNYLNLFIPYGGR